jgi:hypothetical protein
VRQPILTQYCDGRRVSCPNWLTFLQGRTNTRKPAWLLGLRLVVVIHFEGVFLFIVYNLFNNAF